MSQIKQLMIAFKDTIQEAGDMGAPLGPMYSACMSIGMTLEQFNAIISGMTDAGIIRVSNHVAYYQESK